MKKSFTVSREVPVQIDQYRTVKYFESITLEYSEEDMEAKTIIDSVEFEELGDILDKNQRKRILKETGVRELLIDKLKELNSDNESQRNTPKKKVILKRK